MQHPRLRTVYRQRKWLIPAPVRKIMALAQSGLVERKML